MALINVYNGPPVLPTAMWATVRFLASEKRPVRLDKARNVLSPPTVYADDKLLDAAIYGLASLGLLNKSDDERLELTGPAKDLDGTNYSGFVSVLRVAVLAADLNSGLGDDDSQVGPRDLCRALCWFLTQDPFGEPMNWLAVELRQNNALKPEVGEVFSTNARWSPFVAWVTTLGFGAPTLAIKPGTASHVVADCTPAVRETVRSLWKPGDTVSATDFLHGLRRSLPVLPGGAYSLAVGLDSPGDDSAGPALSHALLRGVDEGWLELQRFADARQILSVYDPENPDFPRSYNSAKIGGDLHA
ncbi:protein DpdG [Nocardia sp. NBC_01730]|uniref:protein DpdG n=1 Tax=Nocardia sp. NBC_01730 TaxID=2975998 RepID=UPI002E16355E|nr:protein DpdG [Nocardia sp. NBC_01730]